jgi:hypothetical protein
MRLPPRVLLSLLLLGSMAACNELLSSPPTDAEMEVCDDIDSLYAAVDAAPTVGPAGTFAALGELSVEFRVDELRLREEGNDGLANAVGFLAETLDQLSREGQTDLGLVLLEEARQAAASIADDASC